MIWRIAECPRREWSRGASDMDEARQGRGAGALRSIEPSLCATLKLPTLWHVVTCPRREWSPQQRSDMDEARRVEARER